MNPVLLAQQLSTFSVGLSRGSAEVQVAASLELLGVSAGKVGNPPGSLDVVLAPFFPVYIDMTHKTLV